MEAWRHGGGGMETYRSWMLTNPSSGLFITLNGIYDGYFLLHKYMQLQMVRCQHAGIER